MNITSNRSVDLKTVPNLSPPSVLSNSQKQPLFILVPSSNMSTHHSYSSQAKPPSQSPLLPQPPTRIPRTESNPTHRSITSQPLPNPVMNPSVSPVIPLESPLLKPIQQQLPDTAPNLSRNIYIHKITEISTSSESSSGSTSLSSSPMNLFLFPTYPPTNGLPVMKTTTTTNTSRIPDDNLRITELKRL